MTYAQSMRYVIIPQTVKRVQPTMTSEFILLFKDTALLSAVGVFELMYRANSIVSRTGNLTPFVVAAVYYLVITIPLINYVSRLEHKLAVSEGAQGATQATKPKRGALEGMTRTVDSDKAGSDEDILSRKKDQKEPVFGVVWFSARMLTDRDTRMVKFADSEVERIKFPQSTSEQERQLTEVLRQESNKWMPTQMALDRLRTLTAAIEKG